ncbi:MAG: AzlC family ABC transporter permease [Proteobacteria bacterium]|jgi:predicted branched-subunit amino acid permease|nr:AzlC family ABC transporter permease [Pseudomonadota bacterium]
MSSLFRKGFFAMLPITVGIIPFGAVMGSVAAEAGLSLWQSSAMNLFVFAGASQLATLDLMDQQAPWFVILATGFVINARFFLYSAAFAPWAKESPTAMKMLSSFFLTDQSYAAMSSQEAHFKTSRDGLSFYLGACLCMFFAWHGSVTLGFIFGNFAPSSWNLDFAIPLSFMSLLVPSLKNRKYAAVALFSSFISVLLSGLPLKLGLLSTAIVSLIFVKLFLLRKTTWKIFGSSS